MFTTSLYAINQYVSGAGVPRILWTYGLLWLPGENNNCWTTDEVSRVHLYSFTFFLIESQTKLLCLIYVVYKL